MLEFVDWLWLKAQITNATVERDALHIYAALIVQLAACFLLKRPLGSWLPWLIVLLAELANEGLDLLLEKEPFIHEWQIVGSIHDLVNTMILPTILLLLARHAPSLFRPHEGPPAEPPEES